MNITQFHKMATFESKDFLGGRGVVALRAHLRGEGGSQMRAVCVHRGGGGQKRPKNCVRTISMPPNTQVQYSIQ